MSELKPCPFCGESAEHGHSDTGDAEIRCSDECYCGAAISGFHRVEDAIAAWNQRVELETEDVVSKAYDAGYAYAMKVAGRDHQEMERKALTLEKAEALYDHAYNLETMGGRTASAGHLAGLRAILLDLKSGKGPTALAMVVKERDRLEAENERLREALEGIQGLVNDQSYSMEAALLKIDNECRAILSQKEEG